MLYSYSLQKTFGAGLLYYILVTEFNLIVLSSLVFPSHVVAGSIFFPHKSDDFLAIQTTESKFDIRYLYTICVQTTRLIYANIVKYCVLTKYLFPDKIVYDTYRLQCYILYPRPTYIMLYFMQWLYEFLSFGQFVDTRIYSV